MSNNLLESYLKEHFPDLVLESPLFYQAKTGIRFELGVPYRGIEHPSYFTNIQLRSTLLFDELFDKDSNILVVVKSYQSIEPYCCFNQGEDVFPRYIKNKNIVNNVECVETEKHYEENGDLSGVSYQYILKCKKEDIDYKGINLAKSHMDFAIKPYISDGVFFINTDKHIIFFMYDDRGLDIVSEEKNSLSNIYEKYNDWILDYDKVKIDNIFRIE